MLKNLSFRSKALFSVCKIELTPALTSAVDGGKVSLVSHHSINRILFCIFRVESEPVRLLHLLPEDSALLLPLHQHRGVVITSKG